MKLLDFIFRRKPSRDQFAKLFIDALRKRGFAEQLSYQADRFVLLYGTGSFFYLGNAYQTYCEASGSQRQKALRSFVAALFESENATPSTLSDAKPLLRPLIRNRGMLEEVRMHRPQTAAQDGALAPGYRSFSEDCIILLALDYPESIRTLTQGPEESWRISFDEALTIARDNLRDIPERFVEIAPGVYRGGWGDGYDTSRALLPDMLQRVGVRGQPVFMMPTRDVLFVTGDRHENGLLAMVEFSRQAAEDGRRISPVMYRYGDLGLEVFSSSNAELTRQAAHLARLYSRADYDAQKADLERIHEQDGEDVFVASYMLYGNSDDPAASFSVATWTRGVATSLPKVDRIAFVRSQSDDAPNEIKVVLWEQAMQWLADALEKEDTYPVRYRTRGFPDDALLARMPEAA